MTSLQILDIKHFMAELLVQSTFHKFLLSEATISTFNTFHIDGHLNPSFFTKEEQEEKGLSSRIMSTWEEVRPICFDLIKGKKIPLSFKFVFFLSPDRAEELLSGTNPELIKEEVNGFLLNVKYDGASLTCITGVSIKTFTMDKTIDMEWDQVMKKFFKLHGIAFEEQ